VRADGLTDLKMGEVSKGIGDPLHLAFHLENHVHYDLSFQKAEPPLLHVSLSQIHSGLGEILRSRLFSQ
jgi:hypothetical protein